ncbi:uncharacterized protein GGS25DRAFT_298430 [Hypoxylon fragiforme]|uniref:uncharacterized protein n=1 Tax=Hypoxylon fragiforme TaxID=63214 RepID=UPI0020C68BB5|nr:uncharacterized protein GGS25DRAFT_298430 [Hypoxylon fragiforme]KAI2608975.1 hypothetical protein GGS25DRAFT_298430 [Hypoxylon fragiforme]
MFAKSFTVALVTITGLLLPAAVFASPAADADALLDARGRTNGQCRFDDDGGCGGRGFCHLVTGEAHCCGTQGWQKCSGHNNHCDAGGARLLVNCD